MWSSFFATFRKEFIHIRRDRGTLIMALSMPLFQMIIFGSMDQTVKNLPTVVVDQDHSSQSRDLMSRMQATHTFQITDITTDSHQAREEIRAGRARVGVIIPPDFHEKRARRSGAKVLVLIDGSDSSASAQALGSINGLIAQENLEEIARGAAFAPPISAQPIILFNPNGRTANYIIPGLIAVLLQMIAVMLAAMSIVREREKGTLEQLLVTPLDPLGLMLGKVAPYLFVGIGQMAMILAVMRFLFDVPISGDLFFLFGIAIIYVFSLLSLGFFISTRAQTAGQAQQMAQLFVLPSMFLSGYIFPFEGLPAPLQVIGQCLPVTHMIAIMRGVVLRGAGLRELLPHVGAILLISFVLVMLSTWSFRKSVTA